MANLTPPSRQARPIDGVLLLDKPIGITSNAAIQRAKRLFGAAKAGHVGTLDPLASGLLPVCFGEATKFSADAFSADKSYAADVLLGVTTTTGDTEGEVTSRKPVDVSREQVLAVLRRFTGKLEQMPPMYSALKHAGKPLYAYARAGQTVERTARAITIHEIALSDIVGERLMINVTCSKGTYIRVLAEDIGQALGCGATLAGLRRTRVGAFGVQDAVGLEQLEAAPTAQRTALLLPVEALVAGLPVIVLTADSAARIVMGQATQTEARELEGMVRLYDPAGRFLGLGELQPDGRLLPKRLVAAPLAAASHRDYAQTAKIA